MNPALHKPTPRLAGGCLEIFDLTNPGSAQTIAGLLGAANLIRGATTSVESRDPAGNVMDGIDDQWLLSPALTLGTTYTMLGIAKYNTLTTVQPVFGTDTGNAYVAVRNTDLNVLTTVNDGAQKSRSGPTPTRPGVANVIGQRVISGSWLHSLASMSVSDGTALNAVPSRNWTHLGRNGGSGTLCWPDVIYLAAAWNRALSPRELDQSILWMIAYLAQKGVTVQL